MKSKERWVFQNREAADHSPRHRDFWIKNTAKMKTNCLFSEKGKRDRPQGPHTERRNVAGNGPPS